MKRLVLVLILIALIPGCLDEVPEETTSSVPTTAPTTVSSTTPSSTNSISTLPTSSTTSSTTIGSTSLSSTTTSIEEVIACTLNTDCGDDGIRVTRNYTCKDNDMYTQYLTFTCRRSGTPDAQCIGKEHVELILSAGANEQCIEDKPFFEFLGDEGTYDGPAAHPYSTLHGINASKYTKFRHDGDYRFRLGTIISRKSRIIGAYLHIIKPDDSRLEWFITNELGLPYIVVDDMRIGISSIRITEDEKYATIWIKVIGA